MTKIDVPINVVELMTKVEERGYKIYVVGGAIRDTLVGKTPKDWDLFTDAPKEVMLETFPNGKIIGGSERQDKMFTLLVDDVEISQFRGNGERTKVGKTIEEHCATCDFTINSLACDKNGKIYEYTSGLIDIKMKVIRFCGNAEDRIKEDPLRILRGLRLSFKNNFYFYDGVVNDIYFAVCNGVLNNIPKERITTEIKEIMKYERGFSNLYSLKIIHEMIPEIKEVIPLEGGEHHDEGVIQHLFNTLWKCRDLSSNIYLQLAGFLHDIGKGKCNPQTTSNGNFTGHEKASTEIVDKFMTNYKFSNKEKEYVLFLVKNHMLFHDDNLSNKRLIQMFDEMENCGVDIMDCIILQYADNQGNMKNDRIKFNEFIKQSKLYHKYNTFKRINIPFTVKQLDINGRDIMTIYEGIDGREIGKILNEVFELVIEGYIKNNKADIMYYLRNK